jgi:hypothetical protein
MIGEERKQKRFGKNVLWPLKVEEGRNSVVVNQRRILNRLPSRPMYNRIMAVTGRYLTQKNPCLTPPPPPPDRHPNSWLFSVAVAAITRAADLLLVNFQGVAVGHFERIGRIRGLDTRAVKEESDRANGLALALAKGVHELLELSAALDLEEDLVVVVGDLDVEVLRRSLLLPGASVLVLARHDGRRLWMKARGSFLGFGGIDVLASPSKGQRQGRGESRRPDEGGWLWKSGQVKRAKAEGNLKSNATK